MVKNVLKYHLIKASSRRIRMSGRGNIYIILLLLCFTQVTEVNAQLLKPHWVAEFQNLGTFSSPRVADLNGDGIKDIVLGAGREEFTECDSSVVALDGRDGKILWNVHARDQIFGSADFMDVTGDGVPEVFIGGRSAEFIAINGKSGQVVWEYFPEGDSIDSRSKGLYNFYNSQFVPDQNSDGVKDILISNGGDVTIEN